MDEYSYVNYVPSVHEMVKHTDNHTKHAFNPNTKEFIPCGKPANDACVTKIITAVVLTMLFLYILLLMIIFSNNGNDATMNPENTFRKLKNDNPNNICSGHLNINSIRYKLEFIKELIGINLEQFFIDGYQLPLRFDRTGGGLLLYFRDHIPCKKT